ncbi:MAG: 4Fe-4S dicluster domain-containing protein [Syntrophobacteraceae bacterium]|nr:4Fe-4S dicluster domain-containing protein [Desulfobacteraceae bacterium]
MSESYISKDKLPVVIGALMGRYRVFGPVFQGQYHEFAELKKPEEADLSFRNTRLSPKALFHPQAERMFEYSLAKDDPEAGILKETAKDYSQRVILGIRPCDARAFQIDDANFDTPTFKDPWWTKRRAASTLVGLACNQSCPTCFCTSVGTGPFDASGLDVLLVDVGEGYTTRAVTEKGKALLEGIPEAAPASQTALAAAAELEKSAVESIGTQFQPGPLSEKSLLEIFNAPFWEEVQFACINCGTCTFVCPTCWCFDIQDEVTGEQGDRLRLWDSCMFPLFTHHGSGHNPRAQKQQRVRQRFMHKLKYYNDKYKTGVACVGCGRCVNSCPVNIDIRDVGRLMSANCTCPA